MTQGLEFMPQANPPIEERRRQWRELAEQPPLIVAEGWGEGNDFVQAPFDRV